MTYLVAVKKGKKSEIYRFGSKASAKSFAKSVYNRGWKVSISEKISIIKKKKKQKRSSAEDNFFTIQGI